MESDGLDRMSHDPFSGGKHLNEKRWFADVVGGMVNMSKIYSDDDMYNDEIIHIMTQTYDDLRANRMKDMENRSSVRLSIKEL